MSLLEIFLISLPFYIYIYTIVDRICRCIEHKTIGHAFEKTAETVGLNKNGKTE